MRIKTLNNIAIAILLSVFYFRISLTLVAVIHVTALIPFGDRTNPRSDGYPASFPR